MLLDRSEREPLLPQGNAPKPRYGNWGWSRDDSADYRALSVVMKRGMRPPRPAGRPVRRISGQLRLF